MKRQQMITTILAAVIIGSGTTAALAEHGPMPGFGGPPPGMEREAEPFGERMANILKLTEVQQSQIKAIIDAEQEQGEALFDKMHESREQLRQSAESTTFDEAAVRAIAVAQSQIEVELTVSHTRTRNKVNALLTPDQRELLSNLRPEGR